MNITGGKYNSLNIETAKFDNVKPTLSKVRQAVFNSLATQGDFETFCDLFAGSGIMTFEAISRGYDVTSVEIDKKTAAFIKKNAEKHKNSFSETVNEEDIAAVVSKWTGIPVDKI